MVCDNSTIYFAPLEFVKQMGTYAKEGIVVHYADEKFIAHSSRCPHMPDIGNLGLGTLCRDTMQITCPNHRFKFCVISGKNKNALQSVRYGDLEIYTVIAEDGNLYIKFPKA